MAIPTVEHPESSRGPSCLHRTTLGQTCPDATKRAFAHEFLSAHGTGSHRDDRCFSRSPIRSAAGVSQEWPRQIEKHIGMEIVLNPAGACRMGGIGAQYRICEESRGKK